MTKVIGLYSSAPRSGKTAVSHALERKTFVRVPFAEPLKDMVFPLLVSIGYTPEQAVQRLYHDKELLLDVFGVSTRHLLQTLGTEWGRTCIAPDMWLRVWQARIKQYEYVVVDDVRFENEAELIRSLGGEVWKITRKGVTNTHTHASEGSLDKWPHFARYIENDGTLEQLLHGVAQIPLGQDGADTPS